MAEEKLLAEWFWIDRYDGSSAALLNMECQGVYRSMLSAAWRRGARLPSDHEAIRRAIRCTPKEWKRCWPKVEGYWRVDGDYLVNDTQLEVYAEAQAAKETARVRAVAAAEARWGKRAQAPAQGDAQASARAKPRLSPPSPSPSPETTTPPNPPAIAGGLGPPTTADLEAMVRELVTYWRWLGRCDPRVAGGFTTTPRSAPDDRNVRMWRKALKVGRRAVAEIKVAIAVRVREDLQRLDVPMWEVEPWPPVEAEEAPAGARRAG